MLNLLEKNIFNSTSMIKYETKLVEFKFVLNIDANDVIKANNANPLLILLINNTTTLTPAIINLKFPIFN